MWTTHQICCVLTQLVREVGYMILGLIFWLKSLCKGGRKRPPIGKPGDKMPLMATKRVCFVRRGQGEHNVAPKNWSLVDPPLNETGQKQVLGLHEVLKPQLKVPALAPETARAMQSRLIAPRSVDLRNSTSSSPHLSRVRCRRCKADSKVSA